MHYISFGEIELAKKIIQSDPSRDILRQEYSGPVLTPSGLVVEYPQTPFELSMPSLNPPMAAMIAKEFAHMKDDQGNCIGAAELEKQKARCYPFIMTLREQSHYDIEPLINIIKTCPFKVLYKITRDDCLSLMRVDERKAYHRRPMVFPHVEIPHISDVVIKNL